MFSKILYFLTYIPKSIFISASKSKFLFFIEKSLYYYRNRSNSNYSPDDHYYQKLCKDGIVIIPNYFDVKKLNIVKKEASNAVAKCGSKKYKDSEFYDSDEDGKLVVEVPKKSRIFELLDKDEFVKKIISAFIGKRVDAVSHNIELKYGLDCLDEAVGVHSDDWRYRLKAFYVIEDINLENAPMRYFLGTHKNSGWRRNHDYLSWAYEATPITPYSFRKIAKSNNFAEVTCTAKAGTLIIADTRGFHGGSILKKGKRLQIVSIFNTYEDPRFRTA